MDYHSLTKDKAPRAAEVLDPFHVVQLAGQKLTKVRCRLRRETAGRRGTRSDPLYRCGRILLKIESPRTDRQREKADEILADPANGPTEAINGRLETLRGIALGFTNLGNYVTRSLLHAGGFRQAIQPHLR